MHPSHVNVSTIKKAKTTLSALPANFAGLHLEIVIDHPGMKHAVSHYSSCGKGL